MNFQDLSKIEKANWYIDLAFRKANKEATEIKSQLRRSPRTIKSAELSRVTIIRNTLTAHFGTILKSFPSIDDLPEFYQELVRVTLEYELLKKSLGAVRWAQQKIDYFSDVYHNKIKRCQDFKKMLSYSREYYGRVSSVVKQVKDSLEYLEHSRKVMKDFPSIKENMFTVCIVGFPNVGKTTLLSKLTPSKPEIADYAFTTKQLNTGYAVIDNHKVQLIDTPGTLNRFDKMNYIEKQAFLATKYCADILLFVFDTGETSYSLKSQIKLLKSLNSFKKDIYVYLSKTDICDDETLKLILEELKKERKSFKSVYKDSKDLKKMVSTLICKERVGGT